MNFTNDIHTEIEQEYSRISSPHKKPRILLCTPEVTELPQGMGNAANLVTAKGGGLGDISASLIHYLNSNSDFELHVVLPKYDHRIKGMAKITNLEIDKLALILSGKGIHLVNDSAFSWIDNPYQDHKIHSRIRRAYAFQRYIINDLLDWLEPDIVHCNDWMTALIPPAAKSKKIKTLFTLHNIFTERQTMLDIELSGIKPIEFCENLFFNEFPEDIKNNWEKHYSSNLVDFTASAIYACDFFNTVSPSFLTELEQNVFSKIVPESIYRVVKDKIKQQKAIGILNAPADKMNPSILQNIVNFNHVNVMEKKPLNKVVFQKEMGLPAKPDTPLFFWPNRLFYQKSPDLLLNTAEYLIRKYKLQIAIVANGDTILEEKCKKLSEKHHNIAYKPFNENLSNLGKAGSDYILMPSRYEPCGLPQMEAVKFGTLPIVRATGGLKDSIKQLNFIKGTGNGFVFDEITEKAFENIIKEALMFYAQPYEVRKPNIQRIMQQSIQLFSLENTAKNYINVYEKLLK